MQNSKPKLDSPEMIPSACGRQRRCSDLFKMLSMGRMWLKDEILEKVHELVNDCFVSGNLMIILL